MCDRFVLHSPKEETEQLFEVSTERDDYFEPDYNITPGSIIPVVYNEGEKREIYGFRWGLIPEDAEKESSGDEYYAFPVEEIGEENGRMEDLLLNRRCIIPANGFYKWKFSEKKSTPFYIRLLSQDLIGLAGVYSIWQSDSGRDVYSCSILTTEANALIQPIDDRMPVILRSENFDVWLSRNTDREALTGLLKPYLLTEMVVNRVSEKVNDTDNNSPELIQPIPK
ncbi:MAG: SOS response-associated peptidase [Balneolaceae bacterium]|nr:SOS response-associated peptidase [Balneolaceae bacterium]